MRERVELTSPTRQVPDELVPIAGEPAGDEGGLDGRRAGKHRDVETMGSCRSDQPSTRIVDPGQARVGDERDPLRPPEPIQHLGGTRRLVVPVIADQTRLDAVPVEQDARPARVLAEDDIGLA